MQAEVSTSFKTIGTKNCQNKKYKRRTNKYLVNLKDKPNKFLEHYQKIRQPGSSLYKLISPKIVSNAIDVFAGH